jgi:bile acid:Na+ symporter, BASS family
MSVDRLINLLVTVTLMEMMVTVGLRVTFAEIVDTARNWQLVTRAALANYLLVPAVAIILLLLFQASPLVAAGFLVLAACPGAPYGPPFTTIARANVPAAVGLMVILAGSSAVISPVLLHVLLPLLAEGEAVRIEPAGWSARF